MRSPRSSSAFDRGPLSNLRQMDRHRVAESTIEVDTVSAEPIELGLETTDSVIGFRVGFRKCWCDADPSIDGDPGGLGGGKQRVRRRHGAALGPVADR